MRSATNDQAREILGWKRHGAATEQLGEVAKRVLDGVKGDRLACYRDGQAELADKVCGLATKLEERPPVPDEGKEPEVGVCRPGRTAPKATRQLARLAIGRETV